MIRQKLTKMEQSATTQMSLSDQYAFSTGKDGWTTWVKTSQLEIACAPTTAAQEMLSGILYGEGVKTPTHKTMEEVKALNPGVSNEQAQAILICSTKTIEARLEKHPAALIQAHVTLINGMGKDAMDKLNQDSEFRNNSEQRRPDPMVTWNTMCRIFYEERAGKGKMSKTVMQNEEKVKLLTMSQKPNETVTDYNIRRLMTRKAVESQGVKVLPMLYANEEAETICFIFSLLPGPYGEWHTALKRSEGKSGNTVAVRLPMTIQEAIEEAEKWKTAGNTQNTVAIKSVFVTDAQMSSNTPALVFGKPALPIPQAYPFYSKDEWEKGSKEEKKAVWNHGIALRDVVNNLTGWRVVKEDAKSGEKDKSKGRSKQTTMITIKEPDTEQEENYHLGLLTYVTEDLDNDDDMPPPVYYSSESEPDADNPQGLAMTPCTTGDHNRRRSYSTDKSEDEGDVVMEPYTEGYHGLMTYKMDESDDESHRPMDHGQTDMPSLVAYSDTESDADSKSDDEEDDVIDLVSIEKDPTARQCHNIHETDEEPDETQCTTNPNKRRQLFTRQSRFRVGNEYRRVISPGRALLSDTSYDTDESITEFVGEMITMEAAARNSGTRAAYQIDLHDGNVLDCYATANRIRPTCLASMANSANGLYDTIHDVTLSKGDNNAYATVTYDRNGSASGVKLYSMRHITAGDEIMWDYGDPASLVMDDNPDTTIGLKTFRDAIANIEINCAECDQDDKNAIEITGPSPKVSTGAKQRNRLWSVQGGTEGDRIYERQSQAIRACEGNPESRWKGHPSAEDARSYLSTTSDRQHKQLPPVTECLYTGQPTRPTFDPLHIVFDNGSAIHICNNRELALNMSKHDEKQMGGVVGSKSVSYSNACDILTHELGRAAYIPESIANIVSQSVAEDTGVDITFNTRNQSYTLTCPSGTTYVFGRCWIGNRRSSHYIMDSRTRMPPAATKSHNEDTVMIHTSVPTVKTNKSRFTKQENQRADEAMKLIKTLGHPPKQMAMSICRSMSNCPVSTDDIARAYDIYGPALEAIQGRTTKATTKTSIASPIELDGDTDRKQVAEADLMFVYGTAYLVVILSPMEFSFVIPVEGKSTPDIHAALSYVLTECGKRNHTITWIINDSEAAMKTSEISELLSKHHAENDNKPSGTHAPRVERRIRFIKDKLRIILRGLPYNVTRNLLKWAAQSACRMTNMQPSSSSTDNFTPREKFLRRHTNYVTDIGPAFGTYVQCTTPNPNNTMESRTEGCIILMPKDSRDTAAYLVLKLSTGKVVARSHFTELPIPDALINHINSIAAKEGILPAYQNTPHEHTQPREEPIHDIQQPTEHDNTDAMQRDIDHDPPQTADYEITEHNIEQEDGTQDVEYEQDTTVRRSQRILQLDKENKAAQEEMRAQKIADDTADQYDFAGTNPMLVDNITLLTIKQAIDKLGDSARTAIKSELTSLLNKGTFQPVHRRELTEAQFKGIIGSKMFVKEKMNPDGTIEKVKARLVGRGDQQDNSLYHDDLGAYTVERSSIMTVAAIAAKEDRVCVTLDVGTAYLNARMPPEYPTIIMRIEPALAAIMAEIDTELQPYIHHNGCIYVKLLRALYGCIESAKLWQLHITKTLTEDGFTSNPYDCCVMNKVTNTNQTTIALHVDDLLITAKRREDVESLVKHLTDKYDKVTVHRGDNLAYLGLNLDFSEHGTVTITADGMVEAIVTDSDTNDLSKPITSSPATTDLYNIDDESPRLQKSDSDHFHSMVARIAYLARMCRLECVGAIAFLSTRVTKSTEQDMQKLHHLIRYLHQSHESGHRGFRITPGDGPIQAVVYCDASYGINHDGKSQSGVAVGIGGLGFIDQYSGKQPITAKSSSEAELLCTSNETNRGIRTKNFLQGQGYPSMPVDLNQDNMSTISMLIKGKSTSIKVCYYCFYHPVCCDCNCAMF